MSMLIKAEENHYEIFEALQNKHNVPVVKTSMVEVKNVFTEMKANGEKIIESKEHLDFYEKVREIEVKAEKYFRDHAISAKADGDDKLYKIFTDLADEEKRHVILMEELVKMTSRPTQWLDNAEWNNMEEF